LKDKEIGDLIVPIVPDEARTFGMESLFRQVGIYSHVGQLYEPVDAASLLYYKESEDGQILEEGITEAGSMSSFIAAGTAYATHGINTIPFFIYYSMFGFQRIGDLIWAAGDLRCKGFLLGGTAGRTTLNGEGLQHQDGHTHLFAQAWPNLITYDPAFAFEIAIIIRDGIRRMYEEREDIFYYLTLYNENYPMPQMPEGAREGILKGMYKLRPSDIPAQNGKVNLFGSGPLINEVLKAQKLLAEKYGVASDVWSVTSYKELRRDGLDTERWNLLNPGNEPKVPYVQQALKGEEGTVFVASSDFIKAIADSIAKWVPGPMYTLGTDGYGRSDSRTSLRDFFEVDARYITLAALSGLARQGKIGIDVVQNAEKDLGIQPDKKNPITS
jgi:pyruvate dehydrogenase E1 component